MTFLVFLDYPARFAPVRDHEVARCTFLTRQHRWAGRTRHQPVEQLAMLRAIQRVSLPSGGCEPDGCVPPPNSLRETPQR